MLEKLRHWAKSRGLSEIHSAYKATFESPTGEFVLEHMASKFHLFDASPIGDPLLTAHVEGQRYVVLTILKFLKKDEAQILKMMEESNGRERPESTDSD